MDEVVGGDQLHRSTGRHVAEDEADHLVKVLDAVHRRVQFDGGVPVGRPMVVAEDVAEGYVTPERAKADYGYVAGGDD